MLAAIEWDKIGELLWAGPVATLAVSVAFALLMTGGVRSSDARRAGSLGIAAAYGVLALVGGACFVAIVAYGLRLVIVKS